MSDTGKIKKREIDRSNLLLGALALGILLLTVTLCVGSIIRGERSQETSDALPADKGGLGCVRILVAARDRASGLCDVMMLLSLDRGESRLSVLQIPRDTYVNFKDGSYRKINGAPAALGMDALCRSMEEALGLPIDCYVRLSADAFRRAVDALGGVEMTLSEPMDYEDPAGGLSIHLEAGTRTLSGEEAEWFVRYRADYLRGDLGRLDAQKSFLAALAKKALSVRSPLKMARLAAALLPEVETDLGLSELLGLASAVTELSEDRILFVTAPGEDVRGKNGGSYYVLSARGMERLLSEYFSSGTDAARFDPRRRFLNSENEEFRRIYESEGTFRIYSAKEIGESGISVPRT